MYFWSLYALICFCSLKSAEHCKLLVTALSGWSTGPAGSGNLSLPCFMFGTFHFLLKELLRRAYIWPLISMEINDVSLLICWRKSQVPLMTKKEVSSPAFLMCGRASYSFIFLICATKTNFIDLISLCWIINVRARRSLNVSHLFAVLLQLLLWWNIWCCKNHWLQA